MQRRNNGVGRVDKVQGPPAEFQAKFFLKIIFPLQWKLGHLDIKHLNALLQHPQSPNLGLNPSLVHVGETLNRFAVFGLSVTQKHAFGGSLGELASPDSHSRYKGKGRERRRRKKLGIGRGGKGRGSKEWEGRREWKGREGKERGGGARLGYLSSSTPRGPSYATGC